ncbi:Peroxidase [Mycena sanguinolenta]|uniref:Peroxidase n=1 Tax=Mycena sanguinolenta TaxID=230812 RepID=A0A8H7DLS3_9AGAR|nr:Peroxidase [Mycena sanguinolenta]
MFILLLAATLFPTANGWTYPNLQLDALDTLRWDQIGYNSGPNPNSPGIGTFIAPCTFFTSDTSGNSGRSNAADWIRTAYHDMATYNQTDGTGGLDASIRFGAEQARPENVGDAFNNTINVVSGHANRYVSVADTLAVAAVMAFENCGGPQIAFRGGRVDATEPNVPGVPQPQDTLDAHIADFARSGFTQTEMISLVACGHSFGGVQHAIFPDIVPDLDDPTDTQSVQHFDTTFTNFDNNIASEYIAGTTQNPLVVGSNITTNSDQRIFGSDGNATMLSFANSAELFASTCSTLIARMLDTVPSGVQLTEVVTPLPVKPTNLVHILDGDNMVFTLDVRIWNSTNTSMAVVMLWDDHNGATNSTTLPARRLGTSSAINDLYKATWYGVDELTFDGVAGITTMRFTVNGDLEDQNGLGFPVQDSVLFSTSSCSFSRNPILARIDVAVRNGVNATRVFLEHTSFDSTGAPVVTRIDVPPPTQAVAVNSAYSVWSTNLTDNLFYTIGAEIDGTLINPTWANQAQNFKSC